MSRSASTFNTFLFTVHTSCLPVITIKHHWKQNKQMWQMPAVYHNIVTAQVEVNSSWVTCDHVMSDTVMPPLLRLLLPRCFVNTSPSTSSTWCPCRTLINACNTPGRTVSCLLNFNLSLIIIITSINLSRPSITQLHKYTHTCFNNQFWV